MSISKPLISIIIVNYNGLELLKKCLMSLSKIQFTNYEVILVDNNSSDNSVNYVTKNFPQIILIKLDESVKSP